MVVVAAAAAAAAAAAVISNSAGYRYNHRFPTRNYKNMQAYVLAQIAVIATFRCFGVEVVEVLYLSGLEHSEVQS